MTTAIPIAAHPTKYERFFSNRNTEERDTKQIYNCDGNFYVIPLPLKTTFMSCLDKC